MGVLATPHSYAQEAAASDKPWTLSGTLRGFYDDNYNTQTSGPNKLKSYGVDITPSISALYNEGPNTISAAYFYQLHYFFARPGHQADQDHRFELAFKHRLNTTDYLSLSEAFVDSQEPAVLNSIVTTSPLRANGDNYHNNFALNYNVKATDLLGFLVAYNNNWYHYTGNNQNIIAGAPTYQALLNRFEHQLTLDSRWIITQETTFIVGYQFGVTSHTSGASIQNANQPYLAASSRNFYSHYGYVGVDHEFSETLTASARVGIEASDFYNSYLSQNSLGLSSTPNSLSPYIDLSGVYRYSETGTASLGFRDSQNTTDVSSTYNQISETVYGSISQVLTPISPALTGILTSQYQNSDYNGGSSNNGSDRIFSAGLNFTYAFNKSFSTEIGYNYDRLDSTSSGRKYTRDRVFIGVTAAY